MNVGGTEKALLNMISVIPKEKYDITIFMLEEFGKFLDFIPDEVNVEYLIDYQNIKDAINKPPQLTINKLLRQGKLLKAFSLFFLHLLAKIMKDRSAYFKYLLKDHPVIDNGYDVAAAYAGPMDFISYFVANKIKAEKKIQWIHFDVSKIGFNHHYASKIYKKFNKIFVVSNEGKSKFIHILPDLKDRTEKFLNILSSELIIQMADEGVGFEDHFDGLRILTVGRLSREKGQDLTIPVLAKLKEDGYNVKWYCIGDGNARIEYEKLIMQYGVKNEYILLGAKPNPYPYMKQCDIYVQSSRHEGYCITLSEARCFTNPIISTNFTGANEQISHGKTGLVVGFDIQQMYHAIKQLLDDEKLRNKLGSNLKKEIVDTTREMDKLYELVEGIQYATG